MGHDNHDHGHSTPKNLHKGYFEVPLALGALLWALVILVIKLNCWNPDGTCCDDESCAKEGEKCEKTEMPAAHH
jgi:hypothetical protein